MRHIEVDHLWFQEQEARQMLPIGKADVGDSQADLMTKKVGIELAKTHMKAMGIRFAEETADLWQQQNCIASP